MKGIPEITDKQIEVLDYIIQFKLKHDISPTYQNIGDHFGYTRHNARLHCLALKKKGYIDFEENKSRTIRVL